MEDKVIKKIDDKHVMLITTTEQEQLLKKSALEGQRVDLIKDHEEKLALIDELLAVFQ